MGSDFCETAAGTQPRDRARAYQRELAAESTDLLLFSDECRVGLRQLSATHTPGVLGSLLFMSEVFLRLI